MFSRPSSFTQISARQKCIYTVNQSCLYKQCFPDAETTLLKTLRHNGDLDVDQNYTVSSSVRLPEFVTGDFFVVLETDIYDEVYEFLSEDNNLAATEVCDLLVLL